MVILDDIESYVMQFYDNDTKLKLIDLTLDCLGFPQVIYHSTSLLAINNQRFAKSCLLLDNGMYQVFEQVMRSPHLSLHAAVMSSILEKDLTLAQISQFEYGRNYLAAMAAVYPQSSVLRYSYFIAELARAKSPYYQAMLSKDKLEAGFKRLLKENQADASLWIAYVEIEVLLEILRPDQKLQALSGKVLRSLNSASSADIKYIRVSFLDMVFRLVDPRTVGSVQAFKMSLAGVMGILSDLRIDTSQYADSLNEPLEDDCQDLPIYLSKHATSFLTLGKLADKLLSSFVQLSAQNQLDNTIDSSFINKKDPFSVTDFTVLVVLQTYFGVVAGINVDNRTVETVCDWFAVMQAKIRMLSNVYAKQYRADRLVNEVRGVVLITHNLVRFMQKLMPQNQIRLTQLYSRVYTEMLPLDQAIFELIAEDLLDHTYRFQLLADLKAQGVQLSFAEVLALLFKLKRIDCDGTDNLQEYLLRHYSSQDLSERMLHDLKVSETQRLSTDTPKPTFTWFAHGMQLIYQNCASLTLQEVFSHRLLAHPTSSGRDCLLSMVHRAPYNKVV